MRSRQLRSSLWKLCQRTCKLCACTKKLCARPGNGAHVIDSCRRVSENCALIRGNFGASPIIVSASQKIFLAGYSARVGKTVLESQEHVRSPQKILRAFLENARAWPNIVRSWEIQCLNSWKYACQKSARVSRNCVFSPGNSGSVLEHSASVLENSASVPENCASGPRNFMEVMDIVRGSQNYAGVTENCARVPGNCARFQINFTRVS
jgi:hypothetical protein